jgi:competence protein ComEC
VKIFNRLLLVLLVLVFSFISYYYLNESNRKFLSVAFLDVGQGDSIFIETPNGVQLLIDTGATSVSIRKLSEILPFYDRNIDMVLVTHFDLDHVGSLLNILKKYDVDWYFRSHILEDSKLFLTVEELTKDFEVNLRVLNAGDRIYLGEEIYLDVLWPPKDEFNDRNDASVVIRLVYLDVSFMFTGDISKVIEKTIIGAVNIDIDVLKIGHHGSKTSSDRMFLETLSPEYAVISVGEGNKYGHPDKEVISLLEELGIETLSTSSSGTILFQTNGREVWLINP